MAKNLFGQYRYKDTVIHKLDARAKIIAVVLFSVLLFHIRSLEKMAWATIFVALVVIITRISMPQLFRSIRPFLLFFVFILLMYYFFDRQNIVQGVVRVMRFLVLILLSAVLTFSTSISELIYAIEKLLFPLRITGLKPRRMAIMMAITIRFIPMLFIEAHKVREAQASRGASLKNKKHIAGWVGTLLRKTFRQASSLADALDARGYKDKGHSHFKEYRIKTKDIAALAVIIVLALFFL